MHAASPACSLPASTVARSPNFDEVAADTSQFSRLVTSYHFTFWKPGGHGKLHWLENIGLSYLSVFNGTILFNFGFQWLSYRWIRWTFHGATMPSNYRAGRHENKHLAPIQCDLAMLPARTRQNQRCWHNDQHHHPQRRLLNFPPGQEPNTFTNLSGSIQWGNHAKISLQISTRQKTTDLYTIPKCVNAIKLLYFLWPPP